MFFCFFSFHRLLPVAPPLHLVCERPLDNENEEKEEEEEDESGLLTELVLHHAVSICSLW